MNDESPTGEVSQLLAQGHGAVIGVELADTAVPLLTEHARRLIWSRRRARRGDEIVVVQLLPGGQHHPVFLRFDALHL